jgi:hypothetical protein
VRQSLIRSRRLMLASRKKALAALRAVQDQQRRAQIRRLLESTKTFEDPHYCWKLSTRGGTLHSVAISRETVRGDTATVTLTLHLRNGSVVTEREPLVRTRSGWRIGDGRSALQNNKMQQTRRG